MDSVHFSPLGYKGTGCIVSLGSQITHTSVMGLITLIVEHFEGRGSSLIAVVLALLYTTLILEGQESFSVVQVAFVASTF